VVQLSRESGDLVLEVPGAGGAVERMSAGLSDLALRLDLTGERVDATLRVRGAALGTATGQASMPWRAVPGASALRADLSVPLSGRLEVSVPSLAFTRSLVGEAWRLGGALEARLDLGGTPSAPRVSGSLAGSGLLAEQRELGMRLTDGELKAQIVDNMVDVQTLRFASGKGSVRMSGSLRPDERSEAVLTLERMPIPLGAGQRLVVSGESRAVFSRGVLSLRGALRADEGVIEITGNSTPRVSSDVVVVRNAGEAAARRTEALQRAAARDEAARAARTAAGAPPEGEAAGDGSRGFRILSDLQIDLGDRLRVFGAGLEARLAGQLTLRGRLPDAPRLDGTVRIVQGMYTGFGQKLEIERGTLVFSGAVEAGVAITGTAQVPKLTLVSKPDVPEQDKLSWLVLGVPADSAGSQGAALGAAAALIASSDPRAPSFNVASTVGLDVLSIRSGQTGGLGSSSAASLAQDSIVTLGKRLTDRLFVSYEQSLRGLQNLFRLQYEITERFSIRARVGTSNAIDLLWTKRYD
jgi:translocation and assembly module TamB